MRIKFNNGNEIGLKDVEIGSYPNAVEMDFSRLRKHTENPSIITQWILRNKCLNVNCLLSLEDTNASAKTEKLQGAEIQKE